MDALLHHRNLWLATNAWRAAQTVEALPQRFAAEARRGPPGPVVAVVGKGHLGGIVWVLRQLLCVAARAGGQPIQPVQPRSFSFRFQLQPKQPGVAAGAARDEAQSPQEGLRSSDSGAAAAVNGDGLPN